MPELQTIDSIAIAILAAIFIGSLIALVIVCRHKYYKRFSCLSHCSFNNKGNLTLISANRNFHDVELYDVGFYPEIDEILDNDEWVNDTTGLISHCLAILRTCHHLTERLIAMTIGNVSPHAQQKLSEIIDAAQKISPCVDDVVRSMYPPLDARLLEARSSVLILSVRYLALVTSSICQMPLAAKWIEDQLFEMEGHLQVLKEAGLVAEASLKLQNLKPSQTQEDRQNLINNINCITFSK